MIGRGAGRDTCGWHGCNNAVTCEPSLNIPSSALAHVVVHHAAGSSKVLPFVAGDIRDVRDVERVLDVYVP